MFAHLATRTCVAGLGGAGGGRGGGGALAGLWRQVGAISCQDFISNNHQHILPQPQPSHFTSSPPPRCPVMSPLRQVQSVGAMSLLFSQGQNRAGPNENLPIVRRPQLSDLMREFTLELIVSAERLCIILIHSRLAIINYSLCKRTASSSFSV